MCHASKQEQGAFSNQLKTTSAINANLDKVFGDNQNIIGTLKSGLMPMIQAGAHAYGYNPAEDAAIRSSGAANIAAAGRNAAGVQRSAAISEGAGTSGIPAGAQGAIDSSLAEEIAQKQAQFSNDTTVAGYQRGNEDFYQASKVLPGAVGDLQNQDTSAGELANGSAAAQSRAAQSITQANNAWISPVAGILGSTVNGALNKVSPNQDSYSDEGPAGYNSQDPNAWKIPSTNSSPGYI